MSVDCERLGHHVAAALGTGPAPERLARQRVGFVEGLGRRQASRRSAQRWGLVWGASLALVVVALLGLERLGFGEHWWRPAPTPVAMLAEGEAVPVGSWLQSTGNTKVKVGFSEGSALTLSADSRARLRVLQAGVATVSLEAGVLHCNVIPKTGIAWTIEAGPFQVHVVGTVFEVAWNAETETLGVAVERGEVRVSGAGSDAVQSLGAGSGLVTTLGTEPMQVVPAERAIDAALQRPSANAPPALSVTGAARSESSPPTLGPRPVKVTPEVDSQRAPRRGGAADPGSVRPSPRRTAVESEATASSQHDPAAAPDAALSPRDWRALLLVHDYAGAIAAAEAVGFSDLLETLPATDLLQLGDAARLSGYAGYAERAYVGLRRRFSRSAHASAAAYGLGRLASDVRRNDPDSVRWFSAFLREGPEQGPIAAGARARLMDALLRLGDVGRAEQVARAYLKFHPEGQHRETARKLLGRRGGG